MKQPKKSLLYVEDEGIVRDILCTFIADHYPDMIIDAAASAEEGLALFERQCHDIVLTDITLTGSDGVSLARAVREKAPQTVIVFITGSSDIEPLADFKRSGASHVIIKPVECDVLFGVLDRYLTGDGIS